MSNKRDPLTPKQWPQYYKICEKQLLGKGITKEENRLLERGDSEINKSLQDIGFCKDKQKKSKLDNMGAITKKGMEDFAKLVLKDFPRWKMKWTTCGGVCIHKIKIICVDRRYIGAVAWKAKEHIIHEVSHIRTYPKDLHGKYFYKEYIRLLKRFMIEEARDEMPNK